MMFAVARLWWKSTDTSRPNACLAVKRVEGEHILAAHCRDDVLVNSIGPEHCSNALEVGLTSRHTKLEYMHTLNAVCEDFLVVSALVQCIECPLQCVKGPRGQTQLFLRKPLTNERSMRVLKDFKEKLIDSKMLLLDRRMLCVRQVVCVLKL